MKQLTEDLQSLQKQLKALAQKTEKMAKQLDKMDKAQAPRKPKAKAAKKRASRKAPKVSAADTILATIKRSGKGVDTATLVKKTGLKANSIRPTLSKLKKGGKIKSAGKGVYVKA